MKPKLKLTHIIIALILGAATWKAISLIDYFTGKDMDWKQEAPLHDGRVIVIDRLSKQGPQDPFLNMRMEIGQELTFTHPDTGERIRWPIPQGLQPYMLDFDGGVPYYVLTAYTIGNYNKWACPNPPYLIYRYERGQWGRIPFEQLPSQFRKPNLMDMAKSYEQYIVNSFVSTARLEAYFESHDAPYRVIGRDKVNPIGEGCAAANLFAMDRELEMDEESRRGYLNQLETMPETARAQYHEGMEKLKKELKDKQQ